MNNLLTATSSVAELALLLDARQLRLTMLHRKGGLWHARAVTIGAWAYEGVASEPYQAINEAIELAEMAARTVGAQ